MSVIYQSARCHAMKPAISPDSQPLPRQLHPCEESRVFQSMIDVGKTIEEIAELAHKSTSYIRKRFPLNCLCRDIRLMVGRQPRRRRTRQTYRPGPRRKVPAIQHRPLATTGTLAPRPQTRRSHRLFLFASLLDRIGQGVASSDSQDLLFALPANVTAAVTEMKDRANNLRRAERGLAWLLQCKRFLRIGFFSIELKSLLDRSGLEYSHNDQISTTADAEVIGKLYQTA